MSMSERPRAQKRASMGTDAAIARNAMIGLAVNRR